MFIYLFYQYIYAFNYLFASILAYLFTDLFTVFFPHLFVFMVCVVERLRAITVISETVVCLYLYFWVTSMVMFRVRGLFKKVFNSLHKMDSVQDSSSVLSAVTSAGTNLL